MKISQRLTAEYLNSLNFSEYISFCRNFQRQNFKENEAIVVMLSHHLNVITTAPNQRKVVPIFQLVNSYSPQLKQQAIQTFFSHAPLWCPSLEEVEISNILNILSKNSHLFPPKTSSNLFLPLLEQIEARSTLLNMKDIAMVLNALNKLSISYPKIYRNLSMRIRHLSSHLTLQNLHIILHSYTHSPSLPSSLRIEVSKLLILELERVQKDIYPVALASILSSFSKLPISLINYSSLVDLIHRCILLNRSSELNSIEPHQVSLTLNFISKHIDGFLGPLVLPSRPSNNCSKLDQPSYGQKLALSIQKLLELISVNQFPPRDLIISFRAICKLSNPNYSTPLYAQLPPSSDSPLADTLAAVGSALLSQTLSSSPPSLVSLTDDSSAPTATSLKPLVFSSQQPSSSSNQVPLLNNKDYTMMLLALSSAKVSIDSTKQETLMQRIADDVMGRSDLSLWTPFELLGVSNALAKRGIRHERLLKRISNILLDQVTDRMSSTHDNPLAVRNDMKERDVEKEEIRQQEERKEKEELFSIANQFLFSLTRLDSGLFNVEKKKSERMLSSYVTTMFRCNKRFTSSLTLDATVTSLFSFLLLSSFPYGTLPDNKLLYTHEKAHTHMASLNRLKGLSALLTSPTPLLSSGQHPNDKPPSVILPEDVNSLLKEEKEYKRMHHTLYDGIIIRLMERVLQLCPMGIDYFDSLPTSPPFSSCTTEVPSTLSVPLPMSDKCLSNIDHEYLDSKTGQESDPMHQHSVLKDMRHLLTIGCYVYWNLTLEMSKEAAVTQTLNIRRLIFLKKFCARILNERKLYDSLRVTSESLFQREVCGILEKVNVKSQWKTNIEKEIFVEPFTIDIVIPSCKSLK